MVAGLIHPPPLLFNPELSHHLPTSMQLSLDPAPSSPPQLSLPHTFSLTPEKSNFGRSLNLLQASYHTNTSDSVAPQRSYKIGFSRFIS